MELREWQKVVMDYINNHEDLVTSEVYQSLPVFEVHKRSKISIGLPSESGHSTLAAYIASEMPAAIFINSLDDATMIARLAAKNGLKILPESTMISSYEAFFAITQNQMRGTNYMLEGLKAKIKGKKVVVVDDASEVSNIVIDFIFNVADEETAILLLN